MHSVRDRLDYLLGVEIVFSHVCRIPYQRLRSESVSIILYFYDRSNKRRPYDIVGSSSLFYSLFAGVQNQYVRISSTPSSVRVPIVVGFLRFTRIVFKIVHGLHVLFTILTQPKLTYLNVRIKRNVTASDELFRTCAFYRTECG